MSEPQPGVMHPVDQAFYDLAIKERDYERVRFDRVQAERDALAARVGALQRDLAAAVETRENANTVSGRIELENRHLAARVKELEDRIERALVALERRIGPAETWAQYGDHRSNEARRILRGEDDTTGGTDG